MLERNDNQVREKRPEPEDSSEQNPQIPEITAEKDDNPDLKTHQTQDLRPVISEFVEDQESSPMLVKPPEPAHYSESSDSFAPIAAPVVPETRDVPEFL